MGRRRRRRGPSIGWLVILTGVIIILALILPAGFWWFALAVGLIVAGIWLLQKL